MAWPLVERVDAAELMKKKFPSVLGTTDQDEMKKN
jgi:hypothetical protein